MWSEFDILEAPPPPHRIRILKILESFVLHVKIIFGKSMPPTFRNDATCLYVTFPSL